MTSHPTRDGGGPLIPASVSLKRRGVANPSLVLYCSVSCSPEIRLRGLPWMGSRRGRIVRGWNPPASGQRGVHLFPRPVVGDPFGSGGTSRERFMWPTRGPPLCMGMHPRLVCRRCGRTPGLRTLSRKAVVEGLECPGPIHRETLGRGCGS